MHEIAGNKKIRIDLAQDKRLNLSPIEGVETCYERKHRVEDDKKIVAVTVDVEKLHKVLLSEQFHGNVHRVYDY